MQGQARVCLLSHTIASAVSLSGFFHSSETLVNRVSLRFPAHSHVKKKPKQNKKNTVPPRLQRLNKSHHVSNRSTFFSSDTDAFEITKYLPLNIKSEYIRSEVHDDNHDDGLTFYFSHGGQEQKITPVKISSERIV